MSPHSRRRPTHDAGAGRPDAEGAVVDGAEVRETRLAGLHAAFVDDMADGTAFQRAVRDETGRIVDFLVEYVNEAFARIVELAADRLVGHRALELFPTWADGLFGVCVQVVETGQPQTWDSQTARQGLGSIHADGRGPSVEVSVTRLGDGCAVCVSDVTARRRAEDELFRSQEMLRSVLDTFPQRVFWKDRNSVFVGCNAAFARNLGLAHPSEIVGKSDFDIHTHSDAEMYRADDREIMRSGSARIEYEEPMTRTDGSEGWARTSKVPMRDKDGQVIGLLGAYQDITDQKHAQEALRRSEQFLDSIIENIPVMVFVKDAVTFRFVRLNKAGERILGYPRQRLIDQDSSTLVPSEEEAHFQAFDRLVATTGQAVEIPEETITNPELGVLVMHTIKVPIFGDDGKPRYVLGIFRGHHGSQSGRKGSA